MKFIKILSILLIVMALALTGAGIGIYKWASQDLPDYKDITDYNPPLVTKVLTRDGEILGHFFKEKRFLISLAEMSPWIVKSFLAAEDAGFYEHEGVEFMGIVRAAIQNVKAGEIVQGGSTITQQVIKSLLLSPERSYTRKIREAILAYRLEKHLTKDEILTIYLNQIFLGAGAYGVEAAARDYFGKNARDLTLAESALIAALPKAPSRLNPWRNPQGARHRQLYVLSRLRDLQWISEEEYQEAAAEPLDYQRMADPSWQIGPYYLEEVRRQLIRMFGEEKVYQGGLIVSTGADLKHLEAAQTALRQGLIESSKRRGWQGALENIPPENQEDFLLTMVVDPEEMEPGKWLRVLVTDVQESGAKVRFGPFRGELNVSTMSWARTPDPSRAPEEVRPVRDARRILSSGDVVWASVIEKKDPESSWALALEQEPIVEGAILSADPQTGEVLALAGGYSFNRSHFNRATQARRQPGSAFKPFVYSVALENGFTPASIVLDAPIVYDDYQTMTTWRPKNFEGIFHGPTLLRTALVRSRNLVTIRVAQRIGIGNMINRFKDFGFQQEFPRDLSISLGSVPVSLMDLCQSYSAFARDGSYMPLRLINRVSDSWGKELYLNEDQPVQATSPENAYIITNMLQEVVRDGTGWRARVLNRPVAGKTGTTNDQNDAWYIGYSPYLITGVYVGFDQLTPMGKYETGARAASPIWVNYRQQVESDYPVQDFTRPPGITMARIDPVTGLLAPSNASDSYFLPFVQGTEPTRMSVRADEQTGTGADTSSEEDLLRQTF
ncbi:penicillin-binding protein 1A [Desulfonatronovibrio hydrogenovorans]|uniref:penicillin-binding protein 1A n=1 Tax=Desulfonatronovibrio hydrogenovorans TaxID=53245 RepID=UPI00048E84FC|nr:PBP1A family penicillin-binding protein [Desulfonatronovibrio hydrogenovorans]